MAGWLAVVGDVALLVDVGEFVQNYGVDVEDAVAHLRVECLAFVPDAQLEDAALTD